jgi:formate dehydrogenase maturation protein FdhE
MPTCFACEKTATDVWGIKGNEDDVILTCDDCDIYIALDVWYKQPIAD